MVDKVGAYVDAGASQVILAMRAPFDRDGLERFAAEVLPAFSSDWRAALASSFRSRALRAGPHGHDSLRRTVRAARPLASSLL